MRTLFILIFVSAFVQASDCTIAAALEKLKPGSEFVVRNNSLDSIVWFDERTPVPTRTQIRDEIAACTLAETAAESVKVQASAIVTDTTKTDRERLDALVKILELDK